MVTSRQASAPLALALACAALTSSPSRAAPPVLVPQTPYYLQTETHAPYESCPNPTVLTRASLDTTFDVPLPFDFHYYEGLEGTVTIATDGALSIPKSPVSDSTWNLNQALGEPSEPNGVVAAWWDDLALFPSSGGYVGFSVIGDAPRRIFCVEWFDLSKDNGLATSAHRLAARVLLHEGPSGRIDVHYRAPRGSPQALVSASMGLEDPTGARPVTWAPTDGRCGTGLARCGEDVLMALADTQITVRLDAGTELILLDVTAPAIAPLGLSRTAAVQIESLHAGPIGPVELALEASTDPAFTHPVPVGAAQVSLQPFERREVQVEWTPPAALGAVPLWLRATLDARNQISEPDEANNVGVAPQPTRVVPPAPDLAVARVVVDRRQAAPGESVSVAVQLDNLGPSGAPEVPVALRLSTNPVIGAQDIELGRVTVRLGPEASAGLTAHVTLPPGLVSGAYFIGAQADPDGLLVELDEANNARASLETITVGGGPLEVVGALPRALVLEPYAARLEARGGAAPYAWAIVEGALPEGLELDPSTGGISGRPRRTQRAAFTVELSAADGGRTRAPLQMEVLDADAPLTVVTRSLPRALVGTPYAFELDAAGGPVGLEPRWSARDLPEGFEVTPGGHLVGRPGVLGQRTIVLVVQQGEQRAEREVQLVVTDATTVDIVAAPLPPATFGEPYEARLQAHGGRDPLTWVRVRGDLPEGIRLGVDGRLSGTPERVGEFRFVVEALDAGGGGPALRDTQRFELVVQDAPGFDVVTRALPEGKTGQAYEGVVRATGGAPPYAWAITAGALPSGLQLVSAPEEVRIVGRPEAAGTFDILLEAVDEDGRRAARALSLRIDDDATAAPPSDAGCRCARPAGRGATAPLALVGLAGLVGLRRRRR